MPSSATIMLLLKRVDCNDGIAAYCQALIEGLRKRGDRVVIVSGPVSVSSGSEGRHRSLRDLVEDWIVIDSISRPAALHTTIRRVVQTIRKYAIGVISPQGLAMLPLSRLLKMITGVPVVANRHMVMSGWEARSSGLNKETLVREAIARLLSADRYIAISEEIRQGYRDTYRVPDERITVIPNGIDTSFYFPPSAEEREAARRSFAIPGGHLVCSLVGRLNFVKGHNVLVDAARRIRHRHPDLAVTYLFAGGGDQEAEIRAYAHSEDGDAERFRFLGFLDEARLREVYWATDILALPSRSEGFPIAVVEAMACGCVPIRTRIGGAAQQIIEGETGFGIEIGDSDALAARIVDLADIERRRRMSIAAAKLATGEFGREQMIERTRDVYHSVLR